MMAKRVKQIKTVPVAVYLTACADVQNARCQGIALALAAVNRLHGEPTIVCDVLRGHGITLADLTAARVDKDDMAEIRKCLDQGNAKDRAQLRECLGTGKGKKT